MCCQEKPWLVGSRRFSPSRKMPKRQQKRKRHREQIRRLLLKLLSSTPAQFAGHRCQTQRHSSNILRANIPSLQCPLSLRMCRHKGLWGLTISAFGTLGKEMM